MASGIYAHSESGEAAGKSATEDVFRQRISFLALAPAVRDKLRSAGIETVGQLTRAAKHILAGQIGLSETETAAIDEALRYFGVRLAIEDRPIVEQTKETLPQPGEEMLDRKWEAMVGERLRALRSASDRFGQLAADAANASLLVAEALERLEEPLRRPRPQDEASVTTLGERVYELEAQVRALEATRASVEAGPQEDEQPAEDPAQGLAEAGDADPKVSMQHLLDTIEALREERDKDAARLLALDEAGKASLARVAGLEEQLRRKDELLQQAQSRADGLSEDLTALRNELKLLVEKDIAGREEIDTLRDQVGALERERAELQHTNQELRAKAEVQKTHTPHFDNERRALEDLCSHIEEAGAQIVEALQLREPSPESSGADAVTRDRPVSTLALTDDLRVKLARARIDTISDLLELSEPGLIARTGLLVSELDVLKQEMKQANLHLHHVDEIDTSSMELEERIDFLFQRIEQINALLENQRH